MTHHPPATLPALKLIATMMIVAACAFGGAITFAADRIGGRVIAEPIIVYIALAIAALLWIVAVFVLPAVMPRPLATSDELTITRAYGTRVLTRISIVEGAYLLCMIFFLTTQDYWLVGAAVILLLTMLALRPSNDSYFRWRESLSESSH